MKNLFRLSRPGPEGDAWPVIFFCIQDSFDPGQLFGSQFNADCYADAHFQVLVICSGRYVTF